MFGLRESIRQVWVDSPVGMRLIALAMARWAMARERWGQGFVVTHEPAALHQPSRWVGLRSEVPSLG